MNGFILYFHAVSVVRGNFGADKNHELDVSVQDSAALQDGRIKSQSSILG